MKAALTKADLPLAAPSRGDNGKAGDAKTPGTVVANTAQQAYFADRRQQNRAADVQGACETVRVGILVARSRRHQHNTVIASNTVTPGINGPPLRWPAIKKCRNQNKILLAAKIAPGPPPKKRGRLSDRKFSPFFFSFLATT